MRIFASIGMSLLAAGVVACNPTYTSDADMIRREISVDQITEYLQAHTPGRTICLASSDNFAFADGTSKDFHFRHVKLQDPPPDFMSKVRQESFAGSPNILSVSQCDGWINSKAREAGAALLLINNITQQDANHATAEADMMSGRCGGHLLFKLERDGARWKIVLHSVLVES